MSKLKRKVYSASLRLGWAFYKWSLDKYWEEEDKLWNPLDGRTFHERRRDELLKDPEFRKTYERASADIKKENNG